jgi:hypothetical protein
MENTVSLSKPKAPLARYQKLIEHDMSGDTHEIWESYVNSTQVDEPITFDENFSSHVHSVTNIIDVIPEDFENLYTKEKLLFCYRTVIRTIKSYLEGKYTDFDGHTTSNCCHGMAVLTCNLINSVKNLDLRKLLEEGEQKAANLEKNDCNSKLPCTWWVPQSLIDLACLYVLHFVKEVNPLQGGRTVTTRLKIIAPISTNTCNEIAHTLKKKFSNWIAESYEHYLESAYGTKINGVPIEMWGKYVGEEYLRVDKRGLKYASNLFSMQVILGFLVRSKARVALINDVKDASGQLKNRYVKFFEGDGREEFRLLSSEEVRVLSFFHRNDPVIVLGGCAHSNDYDSIPLQMESWLNSLSSLILAGDVFYPQFFKVTDDFSFDNSPIIPDEKILREILADHSNIKGVSTQNPTLYCSTHYYPASLGQVLDVSHGHDLDTLPFSFIPAVKI